jgi:hypothetical protein
MRAPKTGQAVLLASALAAIGCTQLTAQPEQASAQWDGDSAIPEDALSMGSVTTGKVQRRHVQGDSQ